MPAHGVIRLVPAQEKATERTNTNYVFLPRNKSFPNIGNGLQGNHSAGEKLVADQVHDFLKVRHDQYVAFSRQRSPSSSFVPLTAATGRGSLSKATVYAYI
jgi:hypothetical protein